MEGCEQFRGFYEIMGKLDQIISLLQGLQQGPQITFTEQPNQLICTCNARLHGDATYEPPCPIHGQLY